MLFHFVIDCSLSFSFQKCSQTQYPFLFTCFNSKIDHRCPHHYISPPSILVLNLLFWVCFQEICLLNNLIIIFSLLKNSESSHYDLYFFDFYLFTQNIVISSCFDNLDSEYD